MQALFLATMHLNLLDVSLTRRGRWDIASLRLLESRHQRLESSRFPLWSADEQAHLGDSSHSPADTSSSWYDYSTDQPYVPKCPRLERANPRLTETQESVLHRQSEKKKGGILRCPLSLEGAPEERPFRRPRSL